MNCFIIRIICKPSVLHKQCFVYDRNHIRYLRYVLREHSLRWMHSPEVSYHGRFFQQNAPKRVQLCYLKSFLSLDSLPSCLIIAVVQHIFYHNINCDLRPRGCVIFYHTDRFSIYALPLVISLQITFGSDCPSLEFPA